MAADTSEVVHQFDLNGVRYSVRAQAGDVKVHIDDRLVLSLPEEAARLIAIAVAPKDAGQLTVTPSRAGNVWTNEEEDQVIKDYLAGVTIGEMSRQSNRTRGAIRSRLQQLGYGRAPQAHWIGQPHFAFMNKKQ
jgi:hypothetical protein